MCTVEDARDNKTEEASTGPVPWPELQRFHPCRL